jgi:hypothetical protein
VAFFPSFVTSVPFASVKGQGSSGLASHRPFRSPLLGMVSSDCSLFVDPLLIQSCDHDLRHPKVKLHDYDLEYFPSVMEAPLNKSAHHHSWRNRYYEPISQGLASAKLTSLSSCFHRSYLHSNCTFWATELKLALFSVIFFSGILSSKAYRLHQHHPSVHRLSRSGWLDLLPSF